MQRAGEKGKTTTPAVIFLPPSPPPQLPEIGSYLTISLPPPGPTPFLPAPWLCSHSPGGVAEQGFWAVLGVIVGPELLIGQDAWPCLLRGGPWEERVRGREGTTPPTILPLPLPSVLSQCPASNSPSPYLHNPDSLSSPTLRSTAPTIPYPLPSCSTEHSEDEVQLLLNSGARKERAACGHLIEDAAHTPVGHWGQGTLWGPRHLGCRDTPTEHQISRPYVPTQDTGV